MSNSTYARLRRQTMIAQAVEGLRSRMRIVEIQRKWGRAPTHEQLRRAALACDALIRAGYYR